jgi:hypothetical protein
MKRITFNENNRSGNLLHIEVPGAIVNIRVGLTDPVNGRDTTHIEIIPDKYAGEQWDLEGQPKGTGRAIRLIRRKQK